uniref:GB1/RHD3-type G domain-containing protein n=1 Tax=Rhabditophanes sp. KR3021 TaxID=114890 RepID=A0AC35UAM9_9BILA
MSQAKPPCNETIQIAQSDGDNNYLSNMPNAIISEVLSMSVERIAVFVTSAAVITMIVKVLSVGEIVAISVGAVILPRNNDNVDIDEQNISNKTVENKPEKDDIAASGNIKRNQMTKAIRIVEPDKSNNYTLNLPELEKLLLDKRCVGKKVSIISIAGAYRKGKSFILNFFLRYLNAHKDGQVSWKKEVTKYVNEVKMMIPPTANYKDYHEIILSIISSYLEKPPKDWIKAVEKVEGFSWRGGYERDTIGIMIWGEPFFLRDNNGEDIVVILMDTQGAFDNSTTVKNNAIIFALSTMLASVQIFNTSGNIQEDDLQHLEYFSEYGRLALTESDAKPFQALTFLVRDWNCKHQYEYGFDGGQSLLGKTLDIDQNHHSSLSSLRKNLKNYFEKMKCFLMPHPGLIVSHDPEFTGKLDEMEKDFKIHLESFVEHTFDKNNLISKKINGSDLTCRDLFEYFKKYITIFQGEELPEPKSIFQATAEANNSAAASKAKALYDNEVEIICGADKPFMKNDEFEKRHEEIKCKALESFKNAKKMGGLEYSVKILEGLENYFENKMKFYVNTNASKKAPFN